jgi:hypothetical protein
LGRPDVEALSGLQHGYAATGANPIPNGTLDAVDAEIVGDQVPFLDYPFRITNSQSPDVCVVGGLIRSARPHGSTLWEEWKGGAGVITKSPRTQLVRTELTNVGDGFRAATGDSDNWILRGVKVTRAHDDCVENDQMHNGLIDDSFFNGCYVFYSARVKGGQDHPDSVVTITNSLVKLEQMPFVHGGLQGPGQNGFWKMGTGVAGVNGTSPRLVVSNTVFWVDSYALENDLRIPGYDADGDPATDDKVRYLAPEDCSSNTIVWAGPGAFPDQQWYLDNYPDCFQILSGSTGADFWQASVDEWNTAHNY